MTDDDISKAVQEYFDALLSGICPFCKAEVEEEVEVGLCVYARPCGHRLYQGKAWNKRGRENGNK